MVNWQEAGKKWPLPHPHAVYLLCGLVWGQHYRHSNLQFEGGMSGSFELLEDMGADRLQALEDWLQAEGYAYRFRQKRWRVWTGPDRPGKGLLPDGIDEDENPKEYLSGATINVSIWDMIEKKFREPGDEGTLQGSSSSASPGKEKRGQEAGQEMAGVPGIPGRRSRPSRGERDQGRDPSPKPPTGQWRSPPCHTTVGAILEVAKKAKAQPRQLHLMKARPEQGRGVGPPWEDAS